MTIRELWKQMPATEKAAMFWVPPTLCALFWTLWVIAPA